MHSCLHTLWASPRPVSLGPAPLLPVIPPLCFLPIPSNVGALFPRALVEKVDFGDMFCELLWRFGLSMFLPAHGLQGYCKKSLAACTPNMACQLYK